jgi:hypothetical protein
MKNIWTRIHLNRLVATFLMLSFALPMFAFVEDDQVQYIGGTIGTIAAGTVGKLDTVNEKELRFIAGASVISMPYAKIDSYQYTEEVAHHLGVLPTLAIVMIKYRQRRHYFRISYRDENDKPQSVVLEVAKEMPKAISAVLESRVPKACNGSRSGSCRREQTQLEATKPPVKPEVAKVEVAAK